MTEKLAALQICALADCSTVWMPVDPHTCDTLRSCCIGTLDGNLGAASQIALALGLDPQYFTMAVRLAPEEAYFLHYVLGCLQVSCQQRRLCQAGAIACPAGTVPQSLQSTACKPCRAADA
jgi:hypothetical protein